MLRTVTVLVGNSDNKLTQVDWTRFCRDIGYLVDSMNSSIEFSAPSIGWHTFQNACWVITLAEIHVDTFKTKLSVIREKYLQESVAVIVGNTEFI